MKSCAATKKINAFLKQSGKEPLPVKQGYCQFASALSRVVFERHAWRHFEDRKEAEKFLKQFAQSIEVAA